MTQRTPEEIAREATASIARQTEIDHGDAQNWCPDFTEATILAALRSAVEAEREANIGAIAKLRKSAFSSQAECALFNAEEAIRARGTA